MSTEMCTGCTKCVLASDQSPVSSWLVQPIKELSYAAGWCACALVRQLAKDVVATLWNTLPVDVQSSPSLPVFRQRLKTFHFHKSFPDVV